MADALFSKLDPVRVAAAIGGTYLGSGGISSVYQTSLETVAKVTQVSTRRVFDPGYTGKVQVDYLGDGTKGILIDGTPYLFEGEERQQLLFSVSEYEILRQLAEVPRIPKAKNLYGFMVEGVLTVVTEMGFIPGQSVAYLIRGEPRKQVRLSEAGKYQVIHEIGGTLEQVHQHQVVHQDVKPGNMVYHWESDERTFLVDFGSGEFVRSLGFSVPMPEDRKQFLTAPRQQDGIIIGTLSYIAPERVQSPRNSLSSSLFQSDIYEFAVSCFEILRGRRPPVCDDYTRAFRESKLSPDAFHFRQLREYSNFDRDRLVREMMQYGAPPGLAEAIGVGLDRDPQARKLDDIVREAGTLLSLPRPERYGRVPVDSGFLTMGDTLLMDYPQTVETTVGF